MCETPELHFRAGIFSDYASMFRLREIFIQNCKKIFDLCDNFLDLSQKTFVTCNLFSHRARRRGAFEHCGTKSWILVPTKRVRINVTL